MLVTVRVGYAIARPPSPQNIRYSTITVEAESPLAGRLLADQWTACKPGVEMPTGSKILAIEI